ncbi:MAG TPA: Gfo/Idh/MocA family oxidoreductase [Blastocatellia bacterium]|nr:Gfo/Idh/MocA family oxidoreductase [Blastocatellia bacterium]
MTKRVERRDFLKTVAAAGVVPAAFATGEVLGANERVRVGVIGCGGQGNWDLADFARQPNAEIVALCDVYQGSIDDTLSNKDRKNQEIRLDPGRVQVYKDFRRLLERRDVDAVIVATPDHWHALPTIMACEAGKDVYVEKPLALTIEEGRRMVEAARKHKRVVQVGTQQRSAPHFRRAAEMVRAGEIGKVARVHAWNVGNGYPKGIGMPPDEAPPPGLDWDLYLGPAPKVPFNPSRFLGSFRWFWDYSGGMMTDWGVHHIDIIHWAMGVEAPAAVAASGGKFGLEDNRETPDTLLAVFEYPGFVLSYENRELNARGEDARGYGINFYGTSGTLFIDRSGFEIFPEGETQKTVTTMRMPAMRMRTPRVEESHLDHVCNFLDCVKSRQLPISDVETGHRSTTAPHLANISFRTGRKVRWDAAREQILGDPEAARLLGKKYRAPWKLA